MEVGRPFSDADVACLRVGGDVVGEGEGCGVGGGAGYGGEEGRLEV